MRIASIQIKNLRSISVIALELSRELTVFVGPNSTGKSNLFRAFELFFTGKIDRRNFQAALDMPAWIINATAPIARTTIVVEFEFDPVADKDLWQRVQDFHGDKGWGVPINHRFKIIRYFTRAGSNGFQCSVSGQGTRNTEGQELASLVEFLFKRIEYRYVPSLKDLQSESFREVNEELKSRLLSIWAGSKSKREVREKREKFQLIRGEIEQLIQDSSAGLSDSIHHQFPEVAKIKLAMASTELEDMIGSLDIFADDGHETLMKQKGSGVQGASIIHMLRTLRETAPRGKHRKRLFLWNIEEPETFLHPSAQRKLAALLREQAKNTQILITTHSPLFVSRKTPHANVLIRRLENDGHHVTERVKLPTEDPLKPIRQSLGTSLADSLAVHEVVVLVEGASDVTIFKKAFERLCARGDLQIPADYLAFVPAHGSSQQATVFAVLKSWSPLSKVAAIFDYDKAGRDDGAKKVKVKVTEGVDYFYLPHTATDIVLEDMYPPRIKDEAGRNPALAKLVTIQQRPDGTEISKSTDWNKDRLALFFCESATDAEWQPIEAFVKEVAQKVTA